MGLELALTLLFPALAGATPHGVPHDGYPSWAERTVQVYVNRARADPAADLAGCASTSCAEWACYQPMPPMVWDYDLNRSARFHSANLGTNGAPLQHDSPCVLVSDVAERFPPDGTCDGSASCACEPGTLFSCGASGCTSWYSRIGMFGGSGQAENAATGSDDSMGPRGVFYLWLWETDTDSSCGWRESNGHRANILGGSSALGSGYAHNFWTQDFGYGTPSGIVSGSHEPQAGPGEVSFRANWYDPAPPQDAQVDVDGACTPMSVERGQGGNATYLGTASLDGSCHRYVFAFHDAAGNLLLLPEQGTYGVGDPASCADWDPTPPVLCDGSTCATSSTTGTNAGATTSTGGGNSGAGSTSSGASSPAASTTGGSSTSSTTGGGLARSQPPAVGAGGNIPRTIVGGCGGSDLAPLAWAAASWLMWRRRRRG